MRISIAVLIVAFVVIAGCESGSDDPESTPPRAGTFVDGYGESVSLGTYRGRYVWVDYAAEWCAACTPQTMAIKSVAANASDRLVFVTIMVTEREGYGHPSTQSTAARWAARFGLEPSRVWAGQVPHRYLPRNLLYSPEGEKLFDKVGELSAGQIQAEIARHISGRL